MFGLNRFESWMLKRTIRKLVAKRLTDDLFGLVYDIHRKVYYEDNMFDRRMQLTETMISTISKKEQEIIYDFIG